MELFKSDLYRNFTLGFAVGAVFLGLSGVGGWNGDIATSAQAAEMHAFDPVAPTSEFLIESE